ncbi:MAG TPA: hypothetical protein VFE62_07680 [Gemmataceae bacterium]|nr:hypothetical protein [Gemmataceae bacterium]
MSVPESIKIVEALKLLGATDEALAKFPEHPDDLAFSFAGALIDCPGAIYTDWRFHPADALNIVWQHLYPHGVKGMIEEEDPNNGFPKKIILQHNGVGSRYRIRIKDDEPCLHDIYFALAKVLPADLQVMSLLPYEGTDSYLHIIQPASVFAHTRELLGPWSEKLFAVHETPLQFIKTGGNVKPKLNLVKNYVKNHKKWLVDMEPSFQKDLEAIDKKLQCTNMRELHTEPVAATAEIRRKMLERFLRDFPLSRRFFLCQLEVKRLALKHMTIGSIDVLEGRAQGWEQIHLSLQYDVLAMHIGQEWGSRKLDDIIDQAGRLLALAWTLGDMGVVRWLSEEMIRFPYNFSGWQHTSLEPLLLALYGRWKNTEINWQNYPKAKLGIYQQVFNAWNDPTRLASILEQCCDYHMVRTSDSDIHEYSCSPYNIFPVEIHAIHRLRETEGLPMPTFAHVLMDSPLGVMPAPVHRPPDELLQRIVATATSEVPEFADQLRKSQ